MQVVNIEPTDGNFGPQFKWTLEVVKPEKFSGIQRGAWTSVSPNLKGKFMKWAGACLGRAIEKDEAIDTDDLIGAQVVATIVIKDGDDGPFNKVDGIRTPKTPTKKQTGKASEGFDVGEPEKPAEKGDSEDPFVDE